MSWMRCPGPRSGRRPRQGAALALVATVLLVLVHGLALPPLDPDIAAGAGPGTTVPGTQPPKVPSSITLTSSLNPSLGAQAVTFRMVVPKNFYRPMPTGTVTLRSGTDPMGTATLDGSGRASVTIDWMFVGQHSMSAVYGGDGVYAGSTSAVVLQTVNGRQPNVTLTSSLNPSTRLQAVTFTSHVTKDFFGPVPPTGTVALVLNNTIFAEGPVLPDGHASITTSDLPIGNHLVSMYYSGDAIYAAKYSPQVAQRVNGRATTVSLTSSRNPAPVGGAVTFSVHVARDFFAPTPTGTVSLLEGFNIIGTKELNPYGNATFVTSALVAGTHDVKVFYAGDAIYFSAVSPVVQQVVTP